MIFREKDWAWVLLLIPVVALGSGQQDTVLRDWLNRVARSNQSNSYEGTFVYRCVADVVTMKIVHAATDAGERERLVSLSGPTQHIVHDGEVITSVFPKKTTRFLGPGGGALSIGGTPSVTDESLERNYQLKNVGADRIAGRPTQVVEIKPKDKYRYGFKLWLDDETFLALRSDMVDETGRIIEQILFTDIQMLGTQDALAKVDAAEWGVAPTDAAQVDQHMTPERQLVTDGASPWDVTQLPEGFALTEHVYALDHQARTPEGEHLLFSDGLASVSIFIEKFADNETPFKGVSRMGAVNAFGTVVNGHQVTVVGDVPEATVRMMGQSVTFRAAQ